MDDLQFTALVERSGEDELWRAGSRLKSRAYTALVRKQAESGPIASVTETKARGRSLCVFEDLVQIAPVGEKAKSAFFCNTCHARWLAERMERPPIWWPHCPYASFR
jgi:hypothetical protein